MRYAARGQEQDIKVKCMDDEILDINETPPLIFQAISQHRRRTDKRFTPYVTNKTPKKELRVINGEICIYTDGGCIANPGGAGACAAIVITGKSKHELVEYFPHTTNNRMEIRGAIIGLKSLPMTRCKVTIFSDSKYLVNSMRYHWKRNVNTDLWEELDVLVRRHDVTWMWVKGHAGDLNNEKCDALVADAISKKGADA